MTHTHRHTHFFFLKAWEQKECPSVLRLLVFSGAVALNGVFTNDGKQMFPRIPVTLSDLLFAVLYTYKHAHKSSQDLVL